LLSPENQAALDQAVQDLETLKSKQRIIITQVEPLPQAKEQATEYFQQLKQLHEKHDRLNDKLN
jgi:chromosome segregation ATPase